ncbi:MAG: ABC transporter ATP-binding protein [Betaproteobacteria bacterium]|nr:ABC transporter ATP-binding protein [Betaproteobacteria bacterium]
MTPTPLDADAPLIQLDHVHKQFANGTVALRSMSITIGEHAFVSLVGPSGCGKSTALRLIAGLTEPSAGRIIRHASLGTNNAIGFVFQEPTLMPWTTVAENVYLPLRVQGISRRQAGPRIDAVLDMVGLRSFSKAYPRELSGGMKMRVSIARALITQPKLLLMDEPFAALDEMTRFKLNDDLLALWERHRWTVIFVTHSVYESAYLSTRVVVMAPRPGRVIADLAQEAAYPRRDAFRISAEYGAFCRTISEQLHHARPTHV